MAKGLFISNRSRPDVIPTISIMLGRVRSPNQSDWMKCRRLVKYLKSTRDIHLTLHFDGINIARWHVDATFGVHEDLKLHSRCTIFLSQQGGGMASGSNKQRLNTSSSTIVELVAGKTPISPRAPTSRRARAPDLFLFSSAHVTQDRDVIAPPRASARWPARSTHVADC